MTSDDCDSSPPNPTSTASDAENSAPPPSSVDGKGIVEVSTQPWYRFKGVAIAQGYWLNNMGRGAVLMSNVYLSSSILYLAQEQAGCLDENDRVSSDCDGKAYGFKPATFVSNIAVVSSVLSALFMPVIGAIVDYTNHRKTVGMVSSALIILIQVIQIGTVQKTWLAMTILQAIAGFLYQVLVMSVFAYLPDIAFRVDGGTMARFTSIFTMSMMSSQAAFLVVITALTLAFGLQAKPVEGAQISQTVDAVWSGVFFYFSWKTMESVEARHVLDEGKSLVSAGFLQTLKTVKDINRLYKKGTRWYFLAVLFSASGATAFSVVAVIYLGGHLGLDFSMIGIFFLVTLVFSLPGSMLACYVSNKLDPKRSWRIVMVLLFLWPSAGAVLLDKAPESFLKILTLVWGAGMGVCVGWYYPTAALFFSLSSPKGQETELAGFNVYCTQIIGWLPPLIYSIMIEADVSQTYGMVAVSGFLLISACIISCAGPWSEILEECGRSSPAGKDSSGDDGAAKVDVVESGGAAQEK